VSADDPNGIKEYFIDGTQPAGAIALRTQNTSPTTVGGAMRNPSIDSGETPAAGQTRQPAVRGSESNTEGLF
jgi:hypothetical protein